MARLVVKNGHQKDIIWYDEIGLFAENMDIVLGLTNNIIRRV